MKNALLILVASLLVMVGCASRNDFAASNKKGELASSKKNFMRSDWRSFVPQPVYDDNPGLVDFYWKAWELAREKVKLQKNMPQSPYMDEGLWDDTIWIWDTAFMSLFCKYAPDVFPGVESLNNFYVIMHDGYEKSALRINHPDNPPLFAWVEYDTYKFTGDRERLKYILDRHKYLQRHFEWFANHKPGWMLKGKTAAGKNRNAPTALRAVDIGFKWSGISSGMDNSPRVLAVPLRNLLWVDALAQQGLSALYIARLAKQLDKPKLAQKYFAEYDRIKALVNKYYWNENDGFYYDVDSRNKQHVKVKTPASFWPVLAEMATEKQVKAMVKYVKASGCLGGIVPLPTVSRDNKHFKKPDGNYWRGGVWLPTSYMVIKALEKYKQYDLADEIAFKTIMHMYKTYKNYSPHTIWECYSPTRAFPANHAHKRVREDFCGWSALGPISLFIENVIGIHDVDSTTNTISWRVKRPGRIGLKNLRFNGIVTSMVAEKNGDVKVSSSKPYTLKINGQVFKIQAGENHFKIER